MALFARWESENEQEKKKKNNNNKKKNENSGEERFLAFLVAGFSFSFTLSTLSFLPLGKGWF